MKLNKLFMGFLGALALTACSSEDVVVPDNGGTVGEGEPRYMSVTIRNANPGTRADVNNPNPGEQFDGDGGGKYEMGYAAENQVNSLRFYFFDAAGNPAKVVVGGTEGMQHYYDCTVDTIQPGTPDMPNVEEVLKAVIVVDGTKTDQADRNSLNQMVAIVNFKDSKGDSFHAMLDDKNITLGQLTEIINSEDVARKNGFLMTSSSYLQDGSMKVSTDIDPTDIKATRELALANPVDVYVERVVAKVRVAFNWESSITKKSVDLYSVDEEGNEKLEETGLTAIALKDAKENNIYSESGVTDPDKQVYVIFRGWNLWWTADKSYLFKKVGDWDQNLAWQWNHTKYYRSYWAENPEGVVLGRFKPEHADIPFIEANTDGTMPVLSDKDYANYTAYCLENAADPAADGSKDGHSMWKDGYKSLYNPDFTTSNRTLVYLRATLVTVKGDKAYPLSLAEWGGYKYTKDTVKTAMLEPNNKQFYFMHKEDKTNPIVTDENGNVIESGSTDYTFLPLTEADIELVPGLFTDQQLATDEYETSKRYLSYLQLVKDLFKDREIEGKTLDVVEQLYQKVGEKDGKAIYREIPVEDVNKMLQNVGGAKVWDGGESYYYHEIKHLGKTGEEVVNNVTTATTYGVVRNHIYEVQLNTVYGLGTPVLEYDGGTDHEDWENITPQKPTPDAFFLGARLNILSWRVVNNNNAHLEW